MQRIQFDFKGPWRVQAYSGANYHFNGVEASTGWPFVFGVESKSDSAKCLRYLCRFESNPGCVKVDNEP